MRRSGTVRKFWTPEEDAILIREAKAQLTRGLLQDWNLIAASLPSRSNKDCRKRWVKLSTQANKGPWGHEEDRRLCNAIRQYGQRWTIVAEAVGTRSADQCAKRWQNSLNPELDNSEWHSEDEARLVQAVITHGRNWKLISEEEFPRRSPTDLKNKYVTFERKQKQQQERSAASSYNTPTPSVASLCAMTDQQRRGSSPIVLGSQASQVELQAPASNTMNCYPTISEANECVPYYTAASEWPAYTTSMPNEYSFAMSASDDLANTYPACADPVPLDYPSMDPAVAQLGSGGYAFDAQPAGKKVTLILEDLDQESANEILQLIFWKGMTMNIKVQSQQS